MIKTRDKRLTMSPLQKVVLSEKIVEKAKAVKHEPEGRRERDFLVQLCGVLNAYDDDHLAKAMHDAIWHDVLGHKRADV